MKTQSRSYQPYSQRRQFKKDRKRLIFTLIGSLVLIYLLFFILLPWLIGGLSIFNKLKPKTAVQDSKPITATLAPPVLNIPYEATNTSSIKVNGYALPDIKIEIYLDNSLITTTQTKSDGSFVTDDIDLSLGRNDITGKTIDTQGNKSLASKDIVVIYNNDKPSLTIDSPQDNQQTSDTKITVSGSVQPATNTSVTVNGQRLIVSSDGKFSKDIPLTPGDNSLNITASNNAGNSTTIARKVISTSSTPTPTPNP